MASQVNADLPAWAIRLIAESEAADETAKGLATGLTAEQLNWQPEPNRWSVGQCLEHLCRTNEIYVPAMTKSLEGKPQATVPEITPGWFGRWFIKSYIEPSPTTKRASAPKAIVPSSQVEASVLNRFLESNHAIRDLVRRASRYNVNRIRFPNPFASILRFTVGTGLEIVSKHEQRHLLQATRTKELMSAPGTEREPRLEARGQRAG